MEWDNRMLQCNVYVRYNISQPSLNIRYGGHVWDGRCVLDVRAIRLVVWNN